MSEHRFICHHCDWNWPVHGWLLFDFELARIAHRRHMRKCHDMSLRAKTIGTAWDFGE